MTISAKLLAPTRDDELGVKALPSAGEVSDAIVAFDAQQAVEKSLVAALDSIDAEFPFTHDRGLLMALCEDAHLELRRSLADADLLTPYAANALRKLAGRNGQSRASARACRSSRQRFGQAHPELEHEPVVDDRSLHHLASAIAVLVVGELDADEQLECADRADPDVGIVREHRGATRVTARERLTSVLDRIEHVCEALGRASGRDLAHDLIIGDGRAVSRGRRRPHAPWL